MAEDFFRPREVGFRVFSANSTEVLSRLCATLINNYPLLDPFAEEKILVMNRGMETYLEQAVASNNQIAACLHFYQPWSFIWETLRNIFPKAGETNYFSRDFITWSLMGMIQNGKLKFADLKSDTVYTRLAEYLKDDRDETKAYEFCAQLANAFDQYQMLRPDWIACWNDFNQEDFETFLLDPNGSGKVSCWVKQASKNNLHAVKVLSDNVWQMALWSRLADNLKGVGEALKDEDPSFCDRAGVVGRLIAKLKEAANDKEKFTKLRSVLPQRLFVFGTASLPPIVIDFLKALSSCVSVNFMLLNPCEDYWGDIRPVWGKSFDEYKKKLASYSGTLNFVPKTSRGAAFEVKSNHSILNLQEPDLKNFDFAASDGERVAGHPLLLSLGREEMELLTLLLDGEECADFINAFETYEENSMLGVIKNDLLRLREDEGSGFKHFILPKDDSVRINSCHTIKREVEVLHDAILSRFKQAHSLKEPLEPRDFIVMVPDIENYAPYIDAVFGAVPKDSPKYLPYSISDRTEVSSGLIADAVLKLLDIGVNRITSSLIEELLSVPAIAAKFGIESADVEIIGSWCAKAGIHWGLDDSDASILLADEDQSYEVKTDFPWTFKQGLKRMADGYMSGADPSGVAFTEIEGADAVLMGKFCDFIDKLTQLREVFIPELSPYGNNWQQEIDERILSVFFNDDEDTDRERNRILQIVGKMQETVGFLKEAPKITLPVFSSFMKKQLAVSAENQPFLRGSINFCSLVPMRAVPFKHIYILGLNETDFPRKDLEPGFNLIFAGGLKRRGDRSRVNDDRCLILEALLSAQQSICFSYIGESPVNQKELAPSAVLAEIEDYLADLFTVKTDGESDEDAEKDLKQRLILKNHLSAYHLDNFVLKPYGLKSAGRPASFDENSFIGSESEDSKGKSPGAFASLAKNERWDAGDMHQESVLEVDCEQLCSSLTQPSKYFLKYGLGIAINNDPDNENVDDEPFSLNETSSKRFKADRLVDSLLKDNTDNFESKVENLGKRGVLPYGVLAESSKNYLITQCDKLQKLRAAVLNQSYFEKRRYERAIELSFENTRFNVLIRGEILSPGVMICSFSDNEADANIIIKAWIYSLCLSLSKASSSKVVYILKDGTAKTVDWSLKPGADLENCLKQLIFWHLKIRFKPLLSNKSVLQIKEKQNGDLKAWLEDPLNHDPPETLFKYDKAGSYLFEGAFEDKALLAKLIEDTKAFRKFFIETIYQNNERQIF